MMEARHLEPYDRLSPTLLRKQLEKKSVLVTGGAYGVGAAIVQSFAEAGVNRIILVGRTESKLKGSVEKLARFNGLKVSYFPADISSKGDVQRVFDSLSFSPDILVNNAGFMATPASFVDADLNECWKAFEVNVFGTALVTQSYLRHRRSHQREGDPPAVVINLNTIGAYAVRVPNLSSYGASKSALARLMELVAVDVPETVARFISVHPGAVKTDMAIKSGLDGVFPYTDERLAGNFVVWLSSEEASFLAGRFVWVNWDVDELLAKKEEIVEKDLLRTALSE